MTPHLPRRNGWTALGVSYAARTVLWWLLASMVWATAPAALGWHPTVVSSGSMLPRLHVGDVVVARPIATDRLRVGEVLLVRDPDQPGRLRLHRYVRLAPDGRLILRGDANRQDDSSPVAPAAVRGVGVLRVPVVGLPTRWAADGDGASLLATGLGLGALVLLAGWFRQEPDSGSTSSPPRSRSHTRRRPRPRRRSVRLPRSTGPARAAQPTRPRAGQPALRVGAAAVAFVVLAATAVGGAAPAHATVTGPCGADPAARGADTAWPLAEPGGTTAADASGNNRPGTYSGTGVTYGVDGPCGGDRAVQLDGTSGMVTGTTTFAYTGGAFTEEIWFATTTTTGGVLIGATQGTTPDAPGDEQVYLQNDGRVRFALFSPAIPGLKSVATTTPLNDGVWHHVAATYDPQVGEKIYVDGLLANTNATATNLGNAFVGSLRVGLANVNSYPNQPTSAGFAGRVAGATRYTTALSAAQILQHGRHAFSGVTVDNSDQFTAASYFTCDAVAASPDLGTPFLYYPLAETSGTTVADISGNGRTGTYRNPSGVTFGAPGPCPRDNQTAVTLDGASAYVTSPTQVVAPANYTESIWFRTTTTSGGILMSFGNVVSGSTSTAYGREIYLDNAGHVVQYVWNGSPVTVVSPSTYDDGQWHLATATASSAEGLRLYVDGTLVGADTGVITLDSFVGSWRIGFEGTWYGPNSLHFAGSVAHAAVWTTALSPTQVAAIYAAGTGANSGTCAAAVAALGPTLAYPLSETGGTTVNDASGNGRNGTYYNGPTFQAAGPCPRDNQTAVTLNGTNQFLSADTIVTPPQVFTESLWFRTTSTAGGDLISFGDTRSGGNSSYINRQLVLNTEGHVVNHTDGEANLFSPGTYNDGRWHMATATMSDDGPRLYVDGVLVASLTAPTTQISFAGTWRIGGDSDGGDFPGGPAAPAQYYAGSLAQVVVFPTALSADQIHALYAAGV